MSTSQRLAELALETESSSSPASARSAAASMLLARAGITGPESVFEGPAGLFRAYTPDEDPDPDLVVAPGPAWGIEELWVKRFPTCGVHHHAIEAAIRLHQQHGFVANDIARVDVYLDEVGGYLIGIPFEPGPDPQMDAQFCAPYAVALGLLRGDAALSRFSNAAVRADTEVADLARRTVIARHWHAFRREPDPPDPPPGRQIVRVHLRDGRVLDHGCTREDARSPGILSLEERDFEVFFRIMSAHRDEIDWFDDQTWRNITGSATNIAWLAKQGGAKGIVLDPEDYNGRGPFRSVASRGRTFEKTFEKARERGGQFMRVIADEYPDITFIGLWLMSRNFRDGLMDTTDEQVMQTLRGSSYGLFPAFIDGMLSELPAKATIVDAFESSYNFRHREEFIETYNRIRNRQGPAMRLLSEKCRDTYQRQMEVGFGIYMDKFVNEPDHRFSFGAKTHEERLSMQSGCLLQTVEAVKPGAYYVVEGYANRAGRGAVSLNVAWQSASGHWTRSDESRRFGFDDAESGKWARCVGVVKAPVEARRLVLQVGVSGQGSDDGAIWIDDLAVHQWPD